MLRFNPPPYQQQPTAHDYVQEWSQGLQNIGNTFAQNAQRDQLQQQNNLANALKMYELRSEYGTEGFDEFMNTVRPPSRGPLKMFQGQTAAAGTPDVDPGMTRPMLPPPPTGDNMSPPPAFDETDYARKYGRKGLKILQDKQDRDLDRRVKEKQLNDTGTWSSAGQDDSGNPVLYNNKTGEYRSGALPGGRHMKPTRDPSASSEVMKRTGLVKGAQRSIRDAAKLLTPQVLNEIKAIKLTPGKIYGQLASSEAKNFYRNLSNAVANELYIKSGATATPAEIENRMMMYFPAANDALNDTADRLKMLDSEVSLFSEDSDHSQDWLNDVLAANENPGGGAGRVPSVGGMFNGEKVLKVEKVR